MEYKMIEGSSNTIKDQTIEYNPENKENLNNIKPIYKKNDTVLYNDNCIEVMSHFPNNYVDMIFADPPYNLSNGGITCQAGKMVSVNKGTWDQSKGFAEDLKFHEQWISECRRILKPSTIKKL
jgi:site-specific DNA-methyltransferase (adenine-specific)